MAGLMQAAGLTPRLQFGEILWWFLANASGMAFYDADTQAAAQSALGRALATFHTANDDPSINSYADANFLRTRLVRSRFSPYASEIESSSAATSYTDRIGSTSRIARRMVSSNTRGFPRVPAEAATGKVQTSILVPKR
jgi:hypothetical protein